jgi:hypothetical protein
LRLLHAFGVDDDDNVTVRNPRPPRHAFGVDDNDVLALTPNLVPNAGPAGGSLQLSTTGSLLESADVFSLLTPFSPDTPKNCLRI